MRSSFLNLSLACLLGITASAFCADTVTPIPLADGDAYRLSTTAERGALTVDLRNAVGQWIPLTRKGAEGGWYGYNQQAGTHGTEGVRPDVSRHHVAGQQVVTVTCSIADGVKHRADYFARPGFCLVISELQAATPPTDIGIVRLAPTFDLDISAFSCYAGRSARGILHTGTIASAVPRPGYFGVGPWSQEPGVRMDGFDPRRPYLAFFNPAGGPLVAFVYLRPDVFWRGGRHFLQVWDGAANYLYTGMFDAGHFNTPVPFLVCARADGDLTAFEADLPRMIDEATSIARTSGRLPSLEAEVQATSRLAAMAPRSPSTPTASGWLQAWRERYAYARATDAVAHADAPGALRVLSLLAKP